MSDEKISISIDVTGAEESAKKVEQVASETEKLNRAAGEVNKTPITPKAQTAEATKQLTTYREQLSLLQRKYEELSKLINDGKLTSKSKRYNQFRFDCSVEELEEKFKKKFEGAS